MNIIHYAIRNSKRVFGYAIVFALVLMAFIPSIHIDTDPENMLAEDEEVRVLHNQLKKRYNMHDIIVLGIINEKHKEGVFNKSSLTKIHELSDYIYQLQEVTTEEGNVDGKRSLTGVIKRDVMAPSNIDHIEPVGLGTLKFDWLMSKPPASEAEALEIKEKLMSNDMFKNTIVSEDGKAICIYIPISSKDISHEISSKIQAKIDEYSGDEQFHITGLPVAEDTFGIEMFIQMAVTAPAAMLCIFFLMFYFFKKFKLILSPMIIALLSVICTMGLLIAAGFTVHIMSSMIPIFVMPIAVLDSVHILSEFFDRYDSNRDRKEIVVEVMTELFRPMLFTSLTSAAGFASLALTPIPPVQVFGVFVAFGILLAWLFTITLIPAYIMNMSENSLNGFGLKEEGKDGILLRIISSFSGFTQKYAKPIVFAAIALMGLSAYGISKIQINDNPVKWFTKDHPIRIADKELNKHFGGTYMAYLSLSSDSAQIETVDAVAELESIVSNYLEKNEGSDQQYNDFKLILNSVDKKLPANVFFDELINDLYDRIDESESDEEMIFWEEITGLTELTILSKNEIFKNPEVLDYTLNLENYLVSNAGVGKVNSLSKLIKKINKELHEGASEFHALPPSFAGVGQCIISYQNSHLPERLRHCVDTDFSGLNLWLQLKSGDNKDMEKTITAVDSYFEKNPPPASLTYDWYGLTYINVIWQKKMVNGMLNAFIGSFIVVFIMMWLLFRSYKYALLCMLPLSLTIALIYGVIGYVGKDYDMPVAVLSSLALGLAIDFSIHFLVRSRESIQRYGNWKSAANFMFGEPSRAIVRNVIVIAIGFLPLLFSNLIPYKTVGILLACILSLSGLITLILLPALITIFEKRLN